MKHIISYLKPLLAGSRFWRRTSGAACAILLTVLFAGPATAQNSFNSTVTKISITDCNSGPCAGGDGVNDSDYIAPPNATTALPSSTYPVPIVVSGFSSAVQTVSITLHDFVDPNDGTGTVKGIYFATSAFLLVAPDGRNFAFLQGACNPGGTSVPLEILRSRIRARPPFNRSQPAPPAPLPAAHIPRLSQRLTWSPSRPLTSH
jgi:hypothetical protein